ncbi:unnamed protein product [Chironomus riparius]|uniref:Uncharacterized protein n=1 Tax=Chironomus riparius TaxID=315576 RepID=A0A9N9S960_9DIPT|nr:unnamed protein product [Chironomus riparius]
MSRTCENVEVTWKCCRLSKSYRNTGPKPSTFQSLTFLPRDIIACQHLPSDSSNSSMPKVKLQP